MDVVEPELQDHATTIAEIQSVFTEKYHKDRNLLVFEKDQT
jgi:hypothetical protein